MDCNGCVWSAYSPPAGQLSDDPAYQEWLAAGGKGDVEQQDCYPGPTTTVQYFPPGATPPPPGVPAAQLGATAVSLLPFPDDDDGLSSGGGRPRIRDDVREPADVLVGQRRAMATDQGHRR